MRAVCWVSEANPTQHANPACFSLRLRHALRACPLVFRFACATRCARARLFLSARDRGLWRCACPLRRCWVGVRLPRPPPAAPPVGRYLAAHRREGRSLPHFLHLRRYAGVTRPRFFGFGGVTPPAGRGAPYPTAGLGVGDFIAQRQPFCPRAPTPVVGRTQACVQSPRARRAKRVQVHQLCLPTSAPR
jgi:hypothetical protein